MNKTFLNHLRFIGFVSFIAMSALLSCGPSQEEIDAKQQEETSKKLKAKKFPCETNWHDVSPEYSIIIIDSCEYIIGWAGYDSGGPFLTHKGNCKNHNTQKQE